MSHSCVGIFCCLVFLYLDLARSTSFVPQYATTEWLEITALRRPAYPYIHSGLPFKTLVSPLAIDGACGFLPPTRDSGCFPAILNWMYSQWRFDRTDLFLRLHATNDLMNIARVFNFPWATGYFPSALPFETLVAKAAVSFSVMSYSNFTTEQNMFASPASLCFAITL